MLSSIPERYPSEQLELIWERYQRVQHQAGHEGTGITCDRKTILTSHAFEYGTESKNGVTCFWFVVPRLEVKRTTFIPFIMSTE